MSKTQGAYSIYGTNHVRHILINPTLPADQATTVRQALTRHQRLMRLLPTAGVAASTLTTLTLAWALTTTGAITSPMILLVVALLWFTGQLVTWSWACELWHTEPARTAPDGTDLWVEANFHAWDLTRYHFDHDTDPDTYSEVWATAWEYAHARHQLDHLRRLGADQHTLNIATDRHRQAYRDLNETVRDLAHKEHP